MESAQAMTSRTRAAPRTTVPTGDCEPRGSDTASQDGCPGGHSSCPYSWIRATLSSASFASFSPFLMLTNNTLFFASSARLFGCVGTA